MKNRNQEKKLENIDFKEYFISLLEKSEIKVENEKIGKMMKFLELLYKKSHEFDSNQR